MEKIEDLLTCDCGSVFFTIEQAATFNYSTYNIHAGSSSKIIPHDLTIPYSKCVLCGRIHPPRASYAGRNMLDRTMQVQKLFLETAANLNSNIESKANAAEFLEEGNTGVIDSVKTEPDSGTDTSNDVQSSRGGGRARKVDKS